MIVDEIRISVVMPVRNGAHLIEKQLAALAVQTYSEWELIVSDNGSEDQLLSILEAWRSRFSSLRVVESGDVSGINHARNVGVKAAKYSYIVLCDCDDEVDAQWLERYVDAFRRGALTAGGQLDVVSSLGRTVGFERPQVSLFGGFGYLLFPAGANCGFARLVWEAAGGFDESFRGGGDETEFFWRTQLLGYPLTYVPSARVTYVQRSKLSDVAKQSYAYGRSHVRLYRKFRTLGMPPRRGVRTMLGLVVAVAGVIRDIGRDGSTVKLVSRLCLAAGRLRESISARTIYL